MVRHLYLHIPFCHHICPYCAFYKHRPGRLANRDFVDALLAEARMRRDEIEVKPETIFLGGGTPSLLSPVLMERLCRGLGELFDLADVVEWTVECNPATFDPGKARLFRELGMTRPSLGVQSFQPATLRTLGRDHTPEQGREAFAILREAGFGNISVDLMFSIPGQRLSDWEADLETAIRLEPEHLSCYNLTYEEDTEFLEKLRSGELDADEDRDAAAFYRGLDFLEENGFLHYEISNYARPGYESVHNRAYWTGADYLGLGPGAVSSVGGRRWKSLPDTAGYTGRLLSGEEVRCEKEELTGEDLRIEAIALQLRTSRGVPAGLVAGGEAVDTLLEEGLIERAGDHYRLSRKGKALADPVAAALI